MQYRHRLLLICPVLILLAGIGWTFADGNFEAATGAPGESACVCHGNVNIGSGSVAISAPGGYAANDTLSISVQVENAGISLWGFEITVLDASDLPVGDLIVTDAARTQKSTAGNGRQYIKHTETGTDEGTAGQTEWEFEWIAPSSDAGPVTFYAAGLAANDGSGSNGDSTYTTSHLMATTAVEDLFADQLPTRFTLHQNYPNPFNPSTTIEFALPERSHVRLAVYNVRGQRVRVLHDNVLAPGEYRTRWNGSDSNGQQVASGLYYYRLEAGDFVKARKMVMIK